MHDAPDRVSRRDLCAALALSPLWASAPSWSARAQDPDDAVLRRTLAGLPAGDRGEIAEWFRAECDGMHTPAADLLRSLFHALEVPRYDWPEAPKELPLYDASVHAPAQPIRRRFLSEKSREVEQWRERDRKRNPPRRLRSGWVYDYGERTILRTGDRGDLDRLFENAIAGFLPDQDLGEALVERALDDGSQRDVLRAFGHAYADRSGNAYPGVTLYDAWSSGLEMEMPDVECLGIVHDVQSDWKTWTAPVPGTQHDKLYERIGAWFSEARRHRGLRSALARTFLSAAPVMSDGYDASVPTLHGLWVGVENDPVRMAKKLPSTDDWERWLEQRGKEVMKERTLARAVSVRTAGLAESAAVVRARLVWILREYGALAKRP